MSKGDYVAIRLEVGGKLVDEKIEVKRQGGTVDVEWVDKKGLVVVTVAGRTGKAAEKFSINTAALRSLQEVRRDDV
jgi:hypothetical protein